MGTWQAPQTKEDKKLLRAKLKEFKKLQNDINELFGDDILCDAFASAEDRIELAIKETWTFPSDLSDETEND